MVQKGIISSVRVWQLFCVAWYVFKTRQYCLLGKYQWRVNKALFFSTDKVDIALKGELIFLNRPNPAPKSYSMLSLRCCHFLLTKRVCYLYWINVSVQAQSNLQSSLQKRSVSSGVQAAPPLTGLNEARQLMQVMAICVWVGRGWFEGQELLCGEVKWDIMKM